MPVIGVPIIPHISPEAQPGCTGGVNGIAGPCTGWDTKGTAGCCTANGTTGLFGFVLPEINDTTNPVSVIPPCSVC